MGPLAAGDELPDIYEQLLKDIFSGALTSGDINPATALAVAKKIMKGVTKAYGSTLDEIDYHTPDYDMLSSIERNVFHFSAAKDYHQLRELTTLLKDGDKLRTFAEFRREAMNVLDKFVGTWLKTEYDTAVAGAQMAASWTRFEAHKESMPLLTYRTVGDDRVRQAHAALDAVTKHIDDPFWSTHYPPNDFNCRCDVEQQTGGHETPDADIQYPVIPKMFQTNMAQQGVVFPKGHPYFKGLPKDIKEKAAELMPERKKEDN